MSNNLIKVDSLDFDGIKANIKTFLSGQSVFSDYNFEGSALSTLIDVLAYNLHYHSLYTNLALNESFIDSASKYSSVVSLAKQIGYVQKQVTSAKAKIRVEVSGIQGLTSSELTLPKGTLFKAQVGDREYTFQTYYAKTATISGGKFTFEVDVIEGSFIQTSYVNTTSSAGKFVIPNQNADIQSLTVKVQESVSNLSTQTFNRVTDLLKVTGLDNAYFVKQREDLFYEIYFGNGTIGKALSTGNVVYLDYYIQSGISANGAQQFYYSGGFRGDALYQVTTINVASGGANSESIESIKYNAPRNYVAQNRAVTEKDYVTQVLQQFPYVESISVWGGEDHYPPRYGSVFLCAKPFSRLILTADEKTEIKEYLKENRSMLAIDPIFVDPTYTNIVVKSSVYFNPDNTTKNADDISALAKTTILQYVNSLNALKKNFRYSTLVKLIDGIDKSIVSNITSVAIKQYMSINIGLSDRLVIRLNNPIEKKDGSVKSSRFYLPGQANTYFITNEADGTLYLYEVLSSGAFQKIQDIGQMKFETGELFVNALTISGLYDDGFWFDITVSSYDVVPLRDTILIMDYADCYTTTIVDYDKVQSKTFSSIR